MDRILKLDDAHAQALLAARKSERTALIRRNDAARRLARKAAELPPQANALAALTKERDDRDAEATGHRASYDAAKANAKTAHAADTEAYAEEVFDPAQGHLILRVEAEAKVQGKPPVERKRIQIEDQDCDDYVDSYVKSCAASDDYFDLERQRRDYVVAHPDLFATGPGEPPPVDPVYEALKAAAKAKQDEVQAEMQAQGTILAKYLAGEPVSYYVGLRIESGEIVIGDKPQDDEE